MESRIEELTVEDKPAMEEKTVVQLVPKFD